MAKVEGINLLSYRPVVLTKKAPDLKPGERLLIFTTELVQTHDFFNGAAYLNTIDPKSVERFIDFTHERYKKTNGRDFGHTIPGIFTDEPHHGFVMADTPKGWVYPVNSGWATPWSNGLPAGFQKRWGYDLREKLPELFFRLNGEHFSPVKWHYMEVLHDLFLKNFAAPINKWCNRHRLKFTGHVLAEDLPWQHECHQRLRASASTKTWTRREWICSTSTTAPSGQPSRSPRPRGNSARSGC